MYLEFGRPTFVVVNPKEKKFKIKSKKKNQKRKTSTGMEKMLKLRGIKVEKVKTTAY